MVYLDRCEMYKIDEFIILFYLVLVKVVIKFNGNEEFFIILIVVFFVIFIKFIWICLIFDFYVLIIKEGLLVVFGCLSEKLFRVISEWILYDFCCGNLM